MSQKIDQDVGRFKDIVKGKVKSNLKKLVSSGDMIGQVGGKIVKIPIHSIDLPRFAFGSRDQGGNGMGDGDIGDPTNGSGKKRAKEKERLQTEPKSTSYQWSFQKTNLPIL